MSYTIQCYVREISSDGNIQIRGIDGYRLEQQSENTTKIFNLFFPSVPKDNKEIQNCKIIASDNQINCLKSEKSTSQNETVNSKYQMFHMLLEAKLHNQKIELEVDIDQSNKITINQTKFI